LSQQSALAKGIVRPFRLDEQPGEATNAGDRHRYR
jgi:hypothetical protein